MRTGFDTEPLLSTFKRFLEFAKLFRKFNEDDWSRLRYKEDFDRIFDMKSEDIQCAESIYAKGRNCAGSMSFLLSSFDDIESFPTITSYIDKLESSWIFGSELLEKVLSDAKSHLPKGVSI